jgi:hypothetical protein
MLKKGVEGGQHTHMISKMFTLSTNYKSLSGWYVFNIQFIKYWQCNISKFKLQIKTRQSLQF